MGTIVVPYTTNAFPYFLCYNFFKVGGGHIGLALSVSLRVTTFGCL